MMKDMQNQLRSWCNKNGMKVKQHAKEQEREQKRKVEKTSRREIEELMGIRRSIGGTRRVRGIQK